MRAQSALILAVLVFTVHAQYSVEFPYKSLELIVDLQVRFTICYFYSDNTNRPTVPISGSRHHF